LLIIIKLILYILYNVYNELYFDGIIKYIILMIHFLKINLYVIENFLIKKKKKKNVLTNYHYKIWIEIIGISIRQYIKLYIHYNNILALYISNLVIIKY